MTGFVCNITINLEDSYAMRVLFPLFDNNDRRMTVSREGIDVLTKFIRTNVPNIDATEYITSIGNPTSKAYLDGVKTFKDFGMKLSKLCPSDSPDNNNPLTPLIHFFGSVIVDAHDKGLTSLVAEFSMHRMGQTLMINHTLKAPKDVAKSLISQLMSEADAGDRKEQDTEPTQPYTESTQPYAGSTQRYAGDNAA